jgi:hypothetical protein
LKIVILLTCLVFLLVGCPLPIGASEFEAVYLLKVMDYDDKAIIVRSNDGMYLIEYGVGVPSLWLYEGRIVYIYSPGIFAGVGSRIIIPSRDQDARIWDSEYIGLYDYYVPTLPAPNSYIQPTPVPPASTPPTTGPAPQVLADLKTKRIKGTYQVGIKTGYMFYGPSAKTRVRKTLQKGDLVFVYCEKQGWYWAITWDGTKGYISKNICQPCKGFGAALSH